MRPPLQRSSARTLLLAATLAVAAPGTIHAQATRAEPVTVIIARHAERDNARDPRDPPLDSIGRVRAEALADAVRHAGVEAIYVTQYRRTHETAEPTARALGLTPQVIAAASPVPAHASTLARTLLEKHRGQVVLVVGHSNTIGPIARALGAPAPENLEDHEYEHLYIVTADGTSPARFIPVRFGPPNPPPK